MLNREDTHQLLRSIGRDKSRRYMILSSHWGIKHRQDVAIGTGSLNARTADVIDAAQRISQSPMSPDELAEQVNSTLHLPAAEAADSAAWVRALGKKYHDRSLLIYFAAPVEFSDTCRRLLQDMLLSYDKFFLTMVFDLHWKSAITNGKSAALSPSRVFQLVQKLGHLFMNGRRWAAARRTFDFPNRVLARIPNLEQRGSICMNLGILEHKQFHNTARSLMLYRRAIAAFSRGGRSNPLLRVVYNYLGNAYISLGRYKHAEHAFMSGLEIAQEVQDDYSMSVTYSGLGRIYTRMHRLADAEDAFWTALMHLTRSTRYDGIHHILIGLGNVFLQRADAKTALYYFKRAYKISCDMKMADAIGLSQVNLSSAHRRLGQIKAAREALADALNIFTRLDRPYQQALVHHYFYRFALHIGDEELAERHYETGKKLVDENRFLDMLVLYDRAQVRKWMDAETTEPARVDTPPDAPISKLAGRARRDLQVRFWGTRGSIATCSPQHVTFGGNTSCVSVHAGGRMLVLDAGTGIRFLGQQILDDHKSGADIPILVSHTHWDHIQGFPFFIPAYNPKYRIQVFGPENFNHSIGDLFAEQMRYAFFPVRLGAMKADISFNRTCQGVIPVDFPAKVSAFVLNHPVLVYGYRIEYGGRTIVYATDVEMPRVDRPPLLEGQKPESMPAYNHLVELINEALQPYVAGADLMIFDAMYTDHEIRSKTGWGHSCTSDAIDLACNAELGQMALFHHNPAHTDGMILKRESEMRGLMKKRGGKTRITASREGSIIKL